MAAAATPGPGELEENMLLMKEPIQRLQAVEEAAIQAMNLGDLDRCLFLRMQGLALAKLCMDDPTVQDRDVILAKAHLQLSATYLEMDGFLLSSEAYWVQGYGDQAYWHASRDPSNAPIHEAMGDLFVFARDSGVPMIENDTKRTKKRAKSPKTPSSPNAIGPPDEVLQDFYERALACYDKTKVKQGWDEEAAQFFVLAISSYGMDAHPSASPVAHLNFELGCVYHRLQKHNEALSALNKAHSFCEQQRDLGRNDPLSLMVLKEKGCTFYDCDHFAEGKAVFEELIQLQRKEYGGGSVIVAETLKYMGDCAVGLGNMEEACIKYNRAVRIMKRKYGTHDPNVRELIAYIRELTYQEVTVNEQEESGTEQQPGAE
ncbi:hypothetical protein R1sor_019791 [Riccia sorocarpa]|uniref:Uncharacterized protein n=1 Tax=Riccia sorocarpa TaxID=122646 RepID=A0ABD3IF69_9MARC